MENKNIVTFDGNKSYNTGTFVTIRKGTFRFSIGFSRLVKGNPWLTVAYNKQSNTLLFSFSSKREQQSVAARGDVNLHFTSTTLVKTVLDMNPSYLRGRFEILPNLVQFNGKDWYTTVSLTQKTETKTVKNMNKKVLVTA